MISKDEADAVDKCGTQGGKEETTSPSLPDQPISRSDRNTNGYFYTNTIKIKAQIQIHSKYKFIYIIAPPPSLSDQTETKQTADKMFYTNTFE